MIYFIFSLVFVFFVNLDKFQASVSYEVEVAHAV
jgi:hypothetical protein